jgi:SAM-dependent methyltransferase
VELPELADFSKSKKKFVSPKRGANQKPCSEVVELPELADFSKSKKKFVSPKRGSDSQKACGEVTELPELTDFSKSKKTNKYKTPRRKPITIIGDADETYKIYAFDALYINGADFTTKSFGKREKQLDIIADLFPIQKKIQIHLTDAYKTEITDLYNRKTVSYPIDGLIFTPADETYFAMTVYKWKPPDRNTIDFLIVQAPKKVLGVKPYLPRDGLELYFLLCGIKFSDFKAMNMKRFPEYNSILSSLGIDAYNKSYFPIQFSPNGYPATFLFYSAAADLHGHVAEFHYDASAATWTLVKMRPDRDNAFGNDFRVAEKNFQQYFNPFTLEMLTNATDNYFAENKSQIYVPLTKFNAFTKAQLIRQFEKVDWIVDLACGKGQDLFTYSGFEIKNVLFLDKDKAALETLNQRKYDMQKPELYLFAAPPKTFPTIYSSEIDLTEDAKKIIKKIAEVPLPKGGVDGVIINFALHYILDDEKSLTNLIKLVDEILKPGGIFIFTCFNGPRVFKLLEKIDFQSTFDIYETESLKYSIKKLYKTNTMTDYNQKIGVIHPFSAGEYYDEYLVNIPMVIQAFCDADFELRQNGSFSDWIGKFKTFNPKVAARLTDADLKYARLYQYVSLYKTMIDK